MQDFHFIISRSLYNFLREIAERLNVTVNVLIEIFVVLTIDQIDMLYQESRNENTFMHNFMGIRHLMGDIHVSYGVIVSFMQFMRFLAYSPPQIGE